MPTNVYTMRFNLVGTDNFSPASKQALNSMKNLNETMVNAGEQGAGAAQGLKALAGAYNALIVAKRAGAFMLGAIKPAAEMQVAVQRLQATAGLTAEQVDRLVASARRGAEITPFSPVQAVEQSRRLAMALRDVNATAETLPSVMGLAHTFLEGDLSKSMMIATRLTGALGAGSSELREKLDALAALSRTTGVPINDLTEAFKKLGPILEASGSSFEDAMSVITMAVKAGVPASMATTGLLTGMLRSIKGANRALLEQQGIVVESEGRFVGFRNLFVQLAAVQQRMSQVDFSNFVAQLTGLRAFKGFAGVLGTLNRGIRMADGEVMKLSDAFIAQDDAVQRSSGLLERTTEESMKPLSEQVRVLKESFSTLLVTVFTPLLEPLTRLVEMIRGAVNAVQQFISTAGPLGGVLTGIFQIVMGLIGGFVTFAAVKMTIAGASRIAGQALLWFSEAATFSAAAQATGTTVAGGFIKALFGVGAAAQTSAGLLSRLGAIGSGVFSILGKAVKVFTGPLGWILTAAPLVVSGIKKIFGWGDKKLDAANVKGADLITKSNQQMQEQLKQYEQLRGGIKDFKYAVDKSAEMKKRELPVSPQAMIDKMMARTRVLAGQLPGGAGGEGARVLMERMQNVARVQRELASGRGIRDPKVFEAARQDLDFMVTALKGLSPFATDFNKQLNALSTTWLNAQQNSEAMAQVLRQLGVFAAQEKSYAEERIASLQKERELLRKANAERVAALEKMGTQAAHILYRAWFKQAAMGKADLPPMMARFFQNETGLAVIRDLLAQRHEMLSGRMSHVSKEGMKSFQAELRQRVKGAPELQGLLARVTRMIEQQKGTDRQISNTEGKLTTAQEQVTFSQRFLTKTPSPTRGGRGGAGTAEIGPKSANERTAEAVSDIARMTRAQLKGNKAQRVVIDNSDELGLAVANYLRAERGGSSGTTLSRK